MIRYESAVRRAFNKRSALKRHVILTTGKAFILSAAVLIVGVLLSLDQNDWTWLARSGSMIVVIGIFLTSSQIIENSRRLKIRRSHHEQNFHRDYAEDIKRGTLDRSRSLDEDIWENGLRGFYLLVFGTLVWGFGDLAGLLF